MDAEKAILYVRTHGNAIEQARMEAILWGELPRKAALDEVTRLRKADGGFAFWAPEVSNVCDTAYVLQWLDDLNVHHGPLAGPACRFLIHHQKEDGGWDEVDALRNVEVPEWVTPGRVETRVWLTAFCAHVLIGFGYAEAPETTCPADFLTKNSDKKGRLTGYLRASWIALPLFAVYPGPHSSPFKHALAVVEGEYSTEWQGSYLAWLLRCLRDAELPIENTLVARALRDLDEKQRDDGSWEAEDGEEHAVDATVQALRAFKGYDLI